MGGRPLPTHSTHDIVWVTISAVLVLMMQGGFACLECGLVRAKNTINVAVKNVVDICLAGALFWALGFALMFGPSQGGWLGWGGFALAGVETPWLLAFFFFQMVFCGTAVTIVSGAVAERMRFPGYLLTAGMMAAVVYPLYGHWAWGGFDFGEATGWLGRLGFVDFAGSTVVHSIGGWIALAAILVIGPRAGRFGPRGRRVQGHNLPLSMLGALLLWIGWFGFNGGSTLGFVPAISGVAVNTALAPVAGCLAAMAWSWWRDGLPRVEAMISGILAGLVAITANCHLVSPPAAVLIGAVGGLLSLWAAALLERLEIDDAVSAVPVHLAAGIWGTLAVALLGDVARFPDGHGRLEQLLVQTLGIGVAGGFAFGLAFPLLWAIHRLVGLRVSPEAERVGLNIAEHGASSALTNLLTEMNRQSRDGDFSRTVPIEEHTEAGEIAAQYNLVLDKFRAETEQRERAMQAFRLAKEAAEEASHAKSHFLASMSHELRTPLNAVIGFSELMRARTFGPLGNERYQDYVEDIHGSASHLLSLINDLLDLSKIEANKYELNDQPLALSEAVESALRLVQPVVDGKRLALLREIDPELPEVRADARALRQILINLLSNAAKFTPEGGSITIGAEREPDGRICLRISDTGPGMTRRQIARALEPFGQVDSQTSSAAGQGTGLGLPLARSLLELHGGTFVMQSAPGVGTTVFLRFPLSRVIEPEAPAGVAAL